MEDTISVAGLQLWGKVGITETERATPQRLRVWLSLAPARGFTGLGDDIANTINYDDVCKAAREEVARAPRNLIETLAEDLAAVLLNRFPLNTVEIEIRKYVLQEAEYASVRLRRERVGD